MISVLRSMFLLPARLFGRMGKSKAGRIFLIILGLAALAAAIWFGFPMTGLSFLASMFVRLATIAAIFLLIGLIYLLRWRARRKQAQALEDSLTSVPAGDGGVLAERMQKALAKLKKTGGRNYLYELPWYVIIGPPGAGKTTALENSGIEFPERDKLRDDSAGFGGTRNCDWWFGEDAVLVDTAGRYTTQDSDASSDKASWTSFLEILKKGRPDQPVNGVILAFSVEDMMNKDAETIKWHAQIVRDRLSELHEAFNIDFPVYVLFTKVDLISGFREYFASFGQAQRKGVWGVTFQTRNRKAGTYETVPVEFDALVSRLSDEVIDRMNEEPDGVSRISIFGLPGQMAMLRDNVSEFLRLVFQPRRGESSAILRGFYFTSGTQEGTPIDQVLGAMSRTGDGATFQPSFLSGQGKSYFIHDLLARVIFEERDWVGYDRRAVRRRTILRGAALTTIFAVTFGAMGAFAWSFWQNANLLSDAENDANRYYDTARNEISRALINDPNPSPVLPHLQDLRIMTAGYGNRHEPTRWEKFGLSQTSEIALAADRAYSDGLERMLRPRMILHLENAIPQMIEDERTSEIYRALKVYLLLGSQGVGRGDDAAVLAYFEDHYASQFVGAALFDDRERLMDHVRAMLDLDNDLINSIGIDPEIVRRAREAIVNLPLADQAYASIKDRAITSGVPDFNLVERVSGQVNAVFETVDGSPLANVGVPGLYTFEGYWGFFLGELTEARERLREDSWVLGDAADRVGYDSQLARLEGDLHRVYRAEFNTAWREMLTRIGIARLSLDPPQYDSLSALASPVASPMLELVEAVEEETRLERLYDQIDDLSVEAIAANGGQLSENMGNALFKKLYSSSGVFQRVVLDSLKSKTKVQTRAGNAVAEDTQRRQVERISKDFADWHLLLKGAVPQRPIDFVLQNLGDLRENRRQAALAPTPADETLLGQTLAALTANNSALPETLARQLNEVESEFRAVAQAATMAELNRALNDEVSQFCREFVAPLFPFGTGRHLSPAVFGQFFGPGGRMDSFYTSYLQPHVLRGPDGLEASPDSAIGQSLSPTTLKQFDRAQAIRLAFFASGSPESSVGMSITHTTSSPAVELAVLSLNGTTIQTQPDSNAAEASWPGSSSGVSIEIFPKEAGRASSLSFSQGRWDIVTFLRNGSARGVGNVVDVTHQIGGRSITYRIEFNSTTVPFLMPELSDFACPVSLE